MPNTSPWDQISIPNVNFNVRKVIGKTAVPCFWGRDASGAYLFIVELQGDHTAQYKKNMAIVNGINIDLRIGEQGQQRLILTLERKVDRDLFEGFCRTLSSSIEHAVDSASSLAVALAHIHRWKNFLAGQNQHLSAEQIRGLFAELTFLLELIDRKLSSEASVEAWLGPEKSHQDFIFCNSAVEIKSLSGAERNIVRISSEDQLESLNDSLYLRIYRLSALTDNQKGRSLNEIVNMIHSRLDDANAIEVFDRKLAAYGYYPLANYDKPPFIVNEVRTYYVSDGFPRIIRSQIPSGISNVSYDIKLETITSFECDERILFENN